MPKFVSLSSRTSLAAGPYPERDEPPASPLDRALIAMTSAGASRLSSTRPLERLSRRIEQLATQLTNRSDEQLRIETEALRVDLLRRGFTDLTVARSFALVREISGRQLGLRHHRVQLMGGLAMLEGRLAEMRTGEGKTITAMLTAATAALAGIPVHVITVNEYLSARDAEHLRPAYEALGLSVGLVEHDQDHVQRKAAYACDITYCTNKDVAFDYLRDRIALGQRRSRARTVLTSLTGSGNGDQLILRGLHFAIIDEADSVLIDEARTPLILSGSSDDADARELYSVALELAGTLDRDRDFVLDNSRNSVRLTQHGTDRLQQLARGRNGLWLSRRARNELAEQALTALHLYHRDKHYLVWEGKVQIVDEYTGRVMPDRSWERGLHQMIEVKEQCELTGRRETLARITYQRFFRRYLRLAGMTGTAAEAAAEFSAVYGLRPVLIRPHRPSQNINLGVRIFRTSAARWQAVVASALKMHAVGRPVLIGTRSVAASEHVSTLLTAKNLAHQVLNANQTREEADVIAAAGAAGSITVATNMAGRGTDIRLSEEARRRGGLHVILTEFHESPRVDRQLFGRCGRQGDPGSFEAIVSFEDEVVQRFARRVSYILSSVTGWTGGDVPKVIGLILRRAAQKAAETENRKARRATMRIDEQTESLLAFAGVAE